MLNGLLGSVITQKEGGEIICSRSRENYNTQATFHINLLETAYWLARNSSLWRKMNEKYINKQTYNCGALQNTIACIYTESVFRALRYANAWLLQVLGGQR